MTMLKKSFALTIASATVLALLSAGAADKKVDTSKLPPAAGKAGVTYAADIKPIFEKSCFKCHGAE